MSFDRARRVFSQGVGRTSRIILLSLFALFFVIAPVSAQGVSSDTMSWPVFLLVSGITVFMLGIGMSADIPFFTIVGFLLVFMLGFVIQSGSLMVPTGNTNSSYVYGDNFTGYHWDQYVPGDEPTFLPNDQMVFLFHKNEEKEFGLWTSGNYHEIGWFVMIVGLLASVFSVFATFGGDD